MDLKVMPRSQKGHKFILCATEEVTNYLITVPIYHSKSEEIGEALIENIIHYIKILCTRLYNHGSRQHIHVYSNESLIQEVWH